MMQQTFKAFAVGIVIIEHDIETISNLCPRVAVLNFGQLIAEGAPAAGIGFPNDIHVPLLMIYGSADVYGGNRADDFMHLRGNACLQNDFYELAPKGFSEACHKNANSTNLMPTPLAWYEQIKSKGRDIKFELVEGGGHGMMVDSYSSSVRPLGGGRSMYMSRGASGDARTRLEKRVIAFLESKL